MLTINGKDTVKLEEEETATPDEVSPATSTVLLSEQTFPPENLDQGLRRENSPTIYEDLEAILATIKETLLRIIDFLKPFGRPHVEEEYDEYAE